MLIAVLAIALLIGTVSATLLTYYGRIETSATVGQSVLLDDKDINGMPITETISAVGGDKVGRCHWLRNRASVPVTVQLVSWGGEGYGYYEYPEGVTVTYHKPLGYSWSGKTVHTGGAKPYEVDIKVVDGDCKVTWTFDFPIEGDLGNGNMGVALVIATDGTGKGPAFQIHNNDGTDSNYAWGTWLVSPWGPTIDDGWFGWHSGTLNKPVAELDWVSATGDRYKDGKLDDPTPNPTGTFTITIAKCMLGDEFHWAVWTGVGGFFNIAGNSAYPAAFDWTNPIVNDEVNYAKATIMQPLAATITLLPFQRIDIVICYKFDKAIAPGTFTIYTEVRPA
jgi:hypothetical protein